MRASSRATSSENRRKLRARAGTISDGKANYMPRPQLSRPRGKTKLRGRQSGSRGATPALNALLAAAHSAAAHSPKQATGKSSAIQTELQAPITGEIESQLVQLIRKFGYAKVRDALAPLVTKCKWNDWLCVANAVDRLARKARKQTTGSR